jgi:predicted dehydrogenase
VTSERGNPTGTPQDGGVLWNLAPHDLSIVIHLLGDDVRRVDARQAGDEELVFLTLEFGSGALVEVALSWVAHAKARRMTFTGSEGIAVFDETAVAPLAVFRRRGDEAPAPVAVEAPEAIEPLRAQWEELVAAVRAGRAAAAGRGRALAQTRAVRSASISSSVRSLVSGTSRAVNTMKPALIAA